MKSIGVLFSETWGLFKKVFLKLFLIGLIGIVLMGAFSLLAFGLGWAFIKILPFLRPLLAPLLVGLATLVNVIILMGTTFAWIFGITNQSAGVKECLGLAREKFWSYVWIVSLTILVVMGGCLLLIIPGILFAIWFFFAPFILVDDGSRGKSALQKSRELVRGHWWPVFGRLVILWLITIVLSVIPIAGQLLAILILPFSYCYWFIIYNDLKTQK